MDSAEYCLILVRNLRVLSINRTLNDEKVIKLKFRK